MSGLVVLCIIILSLVKVLHVYFQCFNVASSSLPVLSCVNHLPLVSQPDFLPVLVFHLRLVVFPDPDGSPLYSVLYK